MSLAGILWMVIFASAAATFFGVAAIVTVKGIGDLRHLLRSTKRRDGEA